MAARRAQHALGAGFTLVEVLIALLVMSIGLLAVAGFQTAGARHAELARQRTEATHLAQAKLEELRGYEQIAAASGKRAWADLADGSDAPAIAGNTAYARDWHVALAPAALQRPVEVRVRWHDRAGEPQEIALRTLIARTDPLDAGRLVLPTPGNGVLRRPKDRALTVPVAAQALDGPNRGRAVLPWNGAGGGHLVFDEALGSVVARCPLPPGSATDIAAACTPMAAYLLRGTLSGDWPLEATGIAIAEAEHLAAAPECHVEDARDHNDGSLLPGLRSYACLLQPGDHDGDAASARVWSGRSLVEPPPLGGRAVCRYTRDAASTVNEDHPARYLRVGRTLQHQNFLLTAAGGCPAGTVQHQP